MSVSTLVTAAETLGTELPRQRENGRTSTDRHPQASKPAPRLVFEGQRPASSSHACHHNSTTQNWSQSTLVTLDSTRAKVTFETDDIYPLHRAGRLCRVKSPYPARQQKPLQACFHLAGARALLRRLPHPFDGVASRSGGGRRTEPSLGRDVVRRACDALRRHLRRVKERTQPRATRRAAIDPDREMAEQEREPSGADSARTLGSRAMGPRVGTRAAEPGHPLFLPMFGFEGHSLWLQDGFAAEEVGAREADAEAVEGTREAWWVARVS